MSFWFALLETTPQPNSVVGFVQSNTGLIITAVAFIIIAVIVIGFLKQILINSVLGVIAWLIITFVFPLFGVQVQLSFFPSLVVSAIFGLAGMGVLLVLAFLGIRI